MILEQHTEGNCEEWSFPSGSAEGGFREIKVWIGYKVNN